MTTACVPESVKCLDGVDYEVVKHNTHFEWVVGFENTIKALALEVFDTIGVKDEADLNLALKGIDNFQENVKTKLLELVTKVTGLENVQNDAKKFAAEWAEACQFQIAKKYHLMGEPNAKALRWTYENAIKYIIICGTHLAEKDDSVEFKKEVSKGVQNIVQSIIDSLQTLVNELSKH